MSAYSDPNFSGAAKAIYLKAELQAYAEQIGSVPVSDGLRHGTRASRRINTS